MGITTPPPPQKLVWWYESNTIFTARKRLFTNKERQFYLKGTLTTIVWIQIGSFNVIGLRQKKYVAQILPPPSAFSPLYLNESENFPCQKLPPPLPIAPLLILKQRNVQRYFVHYWYSYFLTIFKTFNNRPVLNHLTLFL